MAVGRSLSPAGSLTTWNSLPARLPATIPTALLFLAVYIPLLGVLMYAAQRLSLAKMRHINPRYTLHYVTLNAHHTGVTSKLIMYLPHSGITVTGQSAK